MIIAFSSFLVLAVWIYLLSGRGAFWRMKAAEFPESVSSPLPRLAVVIPARNEAEFIRQAVASLARQDYEGPYHLFLVDDGSTDGTAERAREAAGQQHLTVLRVGSPPAGWTGKLWAMSEGLRAADSFDPEYVLFTDADIVHPVELLRTLVARAQTGGYDIVSVMARLHCKRVAERALIPAFVFFFFKLFPPAWVADRRRSTAASAGGCLLISRATLARVGGLESIRGAVIDDCALAQTVKRAGGRLWLGLSPVTRSVRRYGGFREIGGMISRTAFSQLHHSIGLLVATVAGMCLIYLAPPLLALTGNFAGALAWLLMSVAYAPALRYHECSVLWAPLLPLVAAFYTGATIHSAIRYRQGRGGAWKGRTQDPPR